MDHVILKRKKFYYYVTILHSSMYSWRVDHSFFCNFQRVTYVTKPNTVFDWGETFRETHNPRGSEYISPPKNMFAIFYNHDLPLTVNCVANLSNFLLRTMQKMQTSQGILTSFETHRWSCTQTLIPRGWCLFSAGWLTEIVLLIDSCGVSVYIPCHMRIHLTVSRPSFMRHFSKWQTRRQLKQQVWFPSRTHTPQLTSQWQARNRHNVTPFTATNMPTGQGAERRYRYTRVCVPLSKYNQWTFQ